MALENSGHLIKHWHRNRGPFVRAYLYRTLNDRQQYPYKSITISGDGFDMRDRDAYISDISQKMVFTWDSFTLYIGMWVKITTISILLFLSSVNKTIEYSLSRSRISAWVTSSRGWTHCWPTRLARPPSWLQRRSETRRMHSPRSTVERCPLHSFQFFWFPV